MIPELFALAMVNHALMGHIEPSRTEPCLPCLQNARWTIKQLAKNGYQLCPIEKVVDEQ